MLLLGVHVIDVLDSLENRQSAGIGQILSEGQETHASRIATRSCPTFAFTLLVFLFDVKIED